VWTSATIGFYHGEHKANSVESCFVVSLSISATPHPNKIVVACPRCRLEYILGYTDDEWHRVKDWTLLAERVLREEHNLRHERDTLELVPKHLVRGR
jgi:hypothetical protein